MKETTLEALKRILNGGNQSIHKIYNDDEKDLFSVLERLCNLGVVELKGKAYYLKNYEHLSKVIEFESVDKYLKWMQKPKKKKMTTFEKIYLFLTVILVVFAGAQFLESNHLKSQVEFYENKSDSLILEFEYSKRKIDSLISINKLLKKDSISVNN